MRLRIVRDSYGGYEVQIWKWYWPFWEQANYCNTHLTVERAEEWAINRYTKYVVKHIDLPQKREGGIVSEEIKCGTFDDWSFGGILKRYRHKQKLGLREYGRLLDIDCANVAHLEQGRHSPPNSMAKLQRLVAPLELSKNELNFIAIAAFNFHLGRLKAKWKFL